MMRYFTILLFSIFLTFFATQEATAQSERMVFPTHVISKVSPNPVLHHATVKLENPSQESLRIEIYNIIGNKVATFYNEHDKEVFAVDASDLDAGMYFYFVFHEDYRISTGRMMVKR